MSASKPSPSRAYLWFDTEFSSLNFDRAELLQVALVITGPDLKRVLPPERDLNLYVQLRPDQPLSSWVRENIPNVIRRCRSANAVPTEELEGRIAAYLDEALGPPHPDIAQRPVLAGNSLHADWFLARRLLPSLLDRVHYRMLDVTALKLQWQDWLAGKAFDKDNPAGLKKYFPGLVVQDDAGQHDAYYDVQASIAELAFYREGFKNA